MGLGSGLAERASILSNGSLAAGITGSGGGSVSEIEGFRRRKKDDVFFCSVWVVDWFDSRDGGAVKAGCLGCGGRTGCLGREVAGCLGCNMKLKPEDDGEVPDAAGLDEPNILLKKPGFSFGWGVTFAGGGAASFAFSYPT